MLLLTSVPVDIAWYGSGRYNSEAHRAMSIGPGIRLGPYENHRPYRRRGDGRGLQSARSALGPFSSDGREVETTANTPITLILNWKPRP